MDAGAEVTETAVPTHLRHAIAAGSWRSVRKDARLAGAA